MTPVIIQCKYNVFNYMHHNNAHAKAFSLDNNSILRLSYITRGLPVPS